MKKLRNSKIAKTIGYILIPLFIWVCLLCLEYMNDGNIEKPFQRWDASGKLFFAMIVMSVLSLVLLSLIKKVWIYATVFSSFTLIVGIINNLKLTSNGDNLVPWDITMAGNIGQLAGFVKISLPPLMFAFIPIAALFILYFWACSLKMPFKWYYKLPVPVIIVVFIAVLWNQPKLMEKNLKKFGMSFNDSILQSSNYSANGFVNAFTINCFALKVSEPENYSANAVESELLRYEGTEAKSSPDVIVILSEAFFDARTLNGTEFSKNPLENWDEITSRDNCVSGMMYTTAHGGGTVRTEFEVLTGLTVDYLINGTSPYLYVTKPLDSYVSNYKNQGYRTIALHSYDGKFYSRNVAYPLLGFDEFITQDDMAKRPDCSFRRGYITDDTFMNTLIDTLENSDSENNFVFGITMENHQKYAKSDPADIKIEVKNESLSEDILDSLTTYTQGLYYADKALKKLVDYIDSREKETVLLYFGDHLPAMGGYQQVYNESGNVDNRDGYTTDELECLYSAPYLVYSNYGVDFKTDTDWSDVSTYYLLSLIADKTGTAKTPYMNLLVDKYKTLPYYHARLGIRLEGKNKSFIKLMEDYTYYKLTD